MLLPFETMPNYWLMAMPEFEWQPDPCAADAQAGLADATATCEPAVTDGGVCNAGVEAGTPAADPLPAMKLVMTGMRWVVVPVWTPKDNPFWDQMNQVGRDEDNNRLDAQAQAPGRRQQEGPADDALDFHPKA